MKGKPWTADEERLLQELVEWRASVEVMAARLGKTKEAVAKKCGRLGLVVVGLEPLGTTTSLVPLPAELPSVEEALRMLAGALRASVEPGWTRWRFSGYKLWQRWRGRTRRF